MPSRADDHMTALVAAGFTAGSIQDRERARLAAVAAEPVTTKKSLNDLYKQTGEVRKIR